MKKLWLASAASLLAFAACSSNSSSSDDDGRSDDSVSGYTATYKFNYEITDDSITTYEPVCEEQNGALVWAAKSEDSYTSAYSYDEATGNIDVGGMTYKYGGSSFPNGLWTAVNSEDSSAYSNALLLGSGEGSNGVLYTGDCYFKDVLVPEYGLDEGFSTYASLLNAEIGCDYISITDASIKMTDQSSDGVTLQFKYGDKSCTNTVSYRYATEKSDCEAAYDEYKNDADASDEFYFDDYSTAQSDTSCMSDFTAYIMTNIAKLLVSGSGDSTDIDFEDLINQMTSSTKLQKKLPKLIK